MENISTALLLAAAILVAIILIAFGMKMFSSTSDVAADTSNISEQMSDTASITTNSTNSELQELHKWTN